MTRIAFLLLAIGTAVLCGCQPKLDPAPTYAIIDLDVIAKRLGQDVHLDKAITSERTEVEQRLIALKEGFEQQLVQKKDEFGSDLTEQQARLLLNLQTQANNHMTTAQRQAENTMRKNAAELVERFREQARTIARSVASERNLSLVVTKNPDIIFTFDSSIDITEEVADRMIASGFRPESTLKSASKTQAVSR